MLPVPNKRGRHRRTYGRAICGHVCPQTCSPAGEWLKPNRCSAAAATRTTRACLLSSECYFITPLACFAVFNLLLNISEDFHCWEMWAHRPHHSGHYTSSSQHNNAQSETQESIPHPFIIFILRIISRHLHDVQIFYDFYYDRHSNLQSNRLKVGKWKHKFNVFFRTIACDSYTLYHSAYTQCIQCIHLVAYRQS